MRLFVVTFSQLLPFCLTTFERVSNSAVTTDGRKSSGGSSKKKKSSKLSRKKPSKTDRASDHDDDNDATDGYDTCSATKCLQPTGELNVTHVIYC